MKSQTSSHYRVLFVFAGFLVISGLALWVMGGRQSDCVVEITSHLPCQELESRFQLQIDRLRQLDRSSLQAESIREYRFHDSGLFPISMVSPVGSRALPLPLADIVMGPDSGSEPGLLDPAVVFAEPKFRYSEDLDLEWFGRDTRFVYLREVDHENRVRLVKLDPDSLSFVDSAAADSAEDGSGSVLRYTFQVKHSGIQRLYGKLFERSYEDAARIRMQWICRQLEDDAR
jgi:hypothetical protein